MKTELLIDTLVRAPRERGDAAASLVANAVSAWLVCALASTLLFGVRPNLAMATHGAMIMIKLAVTLPVAITALYSLALLGIPGRRVPAWSIALPWLLLLLLCMSAVAPSLIPSREALVDRVWTAGAPICAAMILSLTALALPSLYIACRKLAPTRPSLFGLQLGLASAALAASAYVLTCRQDDALFVAVWYGLVMITVAGASALGARRWLAW
jgi:hypothetical protein